MTSDALSMEFFQVNFFEAGCNYQFQHLVVISFGCTGNKKVQMSKLTLYP